MRVLLTTSGIGERLGSLTKFTNKSLVKVGDKYTICYIIESYDQKTEFVVTLGHFGTYVKEFLLTAYPDRNFIFVVIDKFQGKGSSLGFSMLKAREHLQEPFMFHCCDAITTDIILPKQGTNVLYVSPALCCKHYTSIIGKNNIITELNGKNHHTFDYVYTGICYIYNYLEFWDKLVTTYSDNITNSHLNDVDALKLMSKLEYSVLNHWYDTGNIDSYTKLQSVFQPKYVVLEKNYESLCFIKNKVIKFINDKDINTKRITRGRQLYPLSPLITTTTDNFIMMDLIEGSILSSIYRQNVIYDLLQWSKTNLWINPQKNIDYIECCKRFYVIKTLDRIGKLSIVQKNVINGLNCKPVEQIISGIPEHRLVTDTFVQFHGDFILDNIIKTPTDFKIIDWRHEFDNQLYFGDVYYDLAKLRHNLILNHENISAGLYTLEYRADEVIVDLKCNYFQIQQLNEFEKFVRENNYDLEKIKLLTAIIWLNMAPLYEGKFSEFLFYFGKYNLSQCSYVNDLYFCV